MDAVYTATLSGLIGFLSGMLTTYAKFNARLVRIETKVSVVCREIQEIKRRIEELDDELKGHGEELARLGRRYGGNS